MKNVIFISSIIGVIAAGLLFINATPPTTPMASPGYQVGDKAMDFSLKNIDGKMVSLSDFKTAEGFIVVFTCNACPFSVMYEDRIIALDKKYAKKGFPVIAINPNDADRVPEDSYNNMIKRAKDKKFTFPYLLDDTQKIAKTYGATNTPHVYVLKKQEDQYIVRYIGAIDDNAKDASAVTTTYVDNAVDALLKGKKIEKTSAKAIGCTIKWKM